MVKKGKLEVLMYEKLVVRCIYVKQLVDYQNLSCRSDVKKIVEVKQIRYLV